jgi:hypothetical protein
VRYAGTSAGSSPNVKGSPRPRTYSSDSDPPSNAADASISARSTYVKTTDVASRAMVRRVASTEAASR